VIARVAIFALLAGCAAPRQPRLASFEPPTVHQEELQRASAEIRRRDSELSQLDLEQTTVDCPRITRLRDNICTLAARICQIAAEQTPGSSAAINTDVDCADGKSRCKRATERSQARGCPPK
jgi:hypothetical protein